MFRILVAVFFAALLFGFANSSGNESWIRINQLGYTPDGIKVAVWCSKSSATVRSWKLIEVVSGKTIASGKAGKAFGAYGPFRQTARINFSKVTRPGRYYLQAGNTRSPEFEIGQDVYKGSADFCLRYMRQQRSKFNPITKDSCHTQDGFTLYGPMPDSTFIDVSGGWHDATDYLQYVTTSANATFHLLAAYRDFPGVFGDQHLANGLEGANQVPDVLDEAKWGLEWLLKMHPQDDWMFNQLADDRDHMGFRMPALDSQYGRGYQRPVYFLNGEPQIRGKFKNNTTGVSSTAGKFSSAFALGAEVFANETAYKERLRHKAKSAFAFGLTRPGVAQTASVAAPYIYAEDNWMDDMELAAAMLPADSRMQTPEGNPIDYAYQLAKTESLTPWLGADTAAHYQWYPFINVGHYELMKKLEGAKKDTITGFYKQGIEKVWYKAKQNAFYRGVPFIWCSNNLTTSFAIQCYWYRTATGDNSYEELEQANFDWLFGCNPWGTSMVYGLPAWGDTPVDPHASFLKVGNYPVDGGIVDGPVYGSIFNSLLGLTLTKPDEYEAFQSDLAVYHDDSGDYSTNEPTMDGTASLIYLMAAKESGTAPAKKKR
ncbi:MAG: glycoside hydrolase family 9 protein [Chitinophagaceae bacterium]|nr:glycoside hydrolase family 9 protein [Chitinophagaceae bacterium]MCW5929828.1 glycoside hydrolase family 9 protein [Chitinophagaceae bacterium]